jgi:hypothetical protein
MQTTSTNPYSGVLLSPTMSHATHRWIFLLAIFCLPIFPVFAEIGFEDFSEKSGIFVKSPTAASSWGDVNGDGWPDLWVSNHHGRPPSLYVNQRDGTFIDAIQSILDEVPSADFHGAAWADFDSDGDHDLIVTTGGGAGRGISPNYFFVNTHGKLINQAKKLGVEYPKGRGRLPVWFDSNQDGRLDVLLANSRRREAPSAIFLQTASGSFTQDKRLETEPSRLQKNESFVQRAKNWLGFSDSKRKSGISVSEQFAQLADVSGDGKLDVVAYLNPLQIFSIDSARLNNVSDSLKLPNLRSVQDAVIEDFNGDGELDWFLVRARPWVMDVVQTNANSIQGKLANRQNQSKTVRFRSSGDITFGLYRPWMDPTDPARNNKPILNIGSRQVELPEEAFTVAFNDTSVREQAPSIPADQENVKIGFDPEFHEWTLETSVKRLNFVISSTAPIETLETEGLKPSKGGLDDVLLVNKGNKFSQQKNKFTDLSTACASVVAGDFDNDMDVDLYLVCAGPTENLPNILYKNDGKGVFTKVAGAGGAEGSMEGIGNQVVTADFDRDGFLDLFVTNGAGPPPFAAEGPHQLFRNAGNKNNWLEIDLQGQISNRDGIGALVTVETGGKSQVRQQGGGMHSFSQNHARLHFGLGPHQKVEKITVNWPSGTVQTLHDIPVNQILLIPEKTDN